MDVALSLSTSCCPLFLQTQHHSPFKAFKFETNCCYRRSIQVNAAKTKRKPRPSFFEQIRDKWSVKVPPARDKFPWQEPKQQQRQQHVQEEKAKEETEKCEVSGVVLSKAEIDANPSASDDDSLSVTLSNCSITAPWMHGTIPERTHFYSQPKIGGNVEQNDAYTIVDKVASLEKEVSHNEIFLEEDDVLHDYVSERLVNDVLHDHVSVRLVNDALHEDVSERSVNDVLDDDVSERLVNDVLHDDVSERLVKGINDDGTFEDAKAEVGGVSVELIRDKEETRAEYPKDSIFIDEKPSGGNGEYEKVQVDNLHNSISDELPWERGRKVDSVEGDGRRKRSNTELAERLLPEHELKKLRNVALRMYERIKVGAAGITQDLVDAIHEKWRVDEVVKLKFEEPLSCNMRRTHEMLEVSIVVHCYI